VTASGPFHVVNYDSWKIHYATARREDLAKVMDPEDVTAENWYHWHTLCGRDLIGHSLPAEEVNCASCLKAFERARRIYSDLSARLGVS
jgi:hypothetical protein